MTGGKLGKEVASGWLDATVSVTSGPVLGPALRPNPMPCSLPWATEVSTLGHRGQQTQQRAES